MRVAAQHRANAVIARQARAEVVVRGVGEDLARVFQISQVCNAFPTEAMDYLIEPRGLRQPTVERAKTRRGWGRRVNSDHRVATAHAQACIPRAQDAYALLSFALGVWSIPGHIQAPRVPQQITPYYLS